MIAAAERTLLVVARVDGPSSCVRGWREQKWLCPKSVKLWSEDSIGSLGNWSEPPEGFEHLPLDLLLVMGLMLISPSF